MADSAAPGALRAGLVVGGITAMAVVGPLLGVSPAWIALAVILALAALSLDAARFGGRGGHLLAETLPGGEARLRRIAVHEAGHGLLAAAEGLPLRRVLVGSLACLRAGLNSNGSTEFASEFVMPFLVRPAGAAGAQLEAAAQGGVSDPVEGGPPGSVAPGLPAEELIYGESEGGSDDRALLGRIWGLSGFDVATAQLEQRRARREVEQALSRRRPELVQRAERMLAAAPRLFRQTSSLPEGETVQNETNQQETIQHGPIQQETIQNGPKP